MFQKIIKRIPGNIPQISPREKQGHIEDLSSKTRAELLELIERQDKLLNNKNFVAKLPDKGAKISKFRSQLADELSRRDDVDKTCELFSGLKIGKSSVSDEIEWTGKYSKNINKLEELDSDDESDDERNTFKILATQSGVGTYTKQHKIEKPEPSLIKPEDLKDVNSVVPNGTVASITEDAYVKNMCDKFSKPKEKKKEQFKPFRTTKSGGNSSQFQQSKKPPGPHWEVTAATPPPPIHGDVKLITLEESLKLQKEQAAKLKDVQAKHATEKLASQLGVKIGNTLPDPSLRLVYRDESHHTDTSSSSEDELDHSEGELDDEPPEKDGAVVYNIVD